MAQNTSTGKTADGKSSTRGEGVRGEGAATSTQQHQASKQPAGPATSTNKGESEKVTDVAAIHKGGNAQQTKPDLAEPKPFHVR
ncbi:hypothetical protein CL655_03190 [bacterium]|nr:hypothetical protein [bacterium]